MTAYEQDPDVVRWGLHQLDICSISNSGAPDTITHYGRDLSRTEYVREGYHNLGHINMENGEDLFSAEGVREGDYHYSKCISVENDEVIAHALQEELSRLADAEASGSLRVRDDQCGPILAQNWSGGSSKRHGNDWNQEEEGERGNCCSRSSAVEQSDGERQVCPEIVDESTLDGEVSKRLNQMVPVPHVPKINGEIPSADEQISDHQRLMDRLQLYDLVELKVLGDGNCQFRSLSDQIYRSTDHHEFVREQIVFQLGHHRELYAGYVPMNFDDYLKKISKAGEWGDHVTLQAAADSYGVKIFVITSFKDTCYIEILPQIQKSNRVMCLSFWAEVHYNSIYPQGELPELEIKKKKSWTWLWT